MISQIDNDFATKRALMLEASANKAGTIHNTHSNKQSSYLWKTRLVQKALELVLHHGNVELY